MPKPWRVRGVLIAAVHLQPFREDSWYFHSANHAIRVWHD